MEKEIILNKLVAAHDALWLKANSIFPALANFAKPEIRVNARLRTTGGRSLSTENWIDFNPHLFADNEREFITDFLPHELAHNIADRLFNERCQHGEKWVYVGTMLTGKILNVKHSLDVSALKRPKAVTIPFACKSKHIIYDFTPQRMAWVRKGKFYLCGTCKSRLYPL
jgi:SprT protein